MVAQSCAVAAPRTLVEKGYQTLKKTKNSLHTRCITPNRVTSFIYPRHCARATQLLLKKCRSGNEPLATQCPN